MNATKFGLAVAAALLISTFLLSGTALAISRGVKQPDGMICRDLLKEPHHHYGKGHGHSRAAALAGAVKRWSRFTVFEYGHAWGDWGIARRKSVDCRHHRLWWCDIKAQPCKH